MNLIYFFTHLNNFCTLTKPWFWKISECWTNHPHQVYLFKTSITYTSLTIIIILKKPQNVSLDVKIFYLIQLSNYWSLVVSQFFDVRRKDFWGMFIHHLATISLLNLSYISNYIRIGVLVQVLHDSADIFLEAGKCLKYINWGWSSDLSFTLFFLVWIVTRLVIYPLHILNQ